MEPQTIPDVPIPILDTSTPNQNTSSAASSTPTTSSSNGVSQQTIQDAAVPSPPIAIDVIGTSLDTQQRKILGAFTFGQVGALKVGTYSFGVSGEVDISPNGITATNVNGITTFSIDGTTGDATFLGTLQAGTLIAGDSNVVIGIGSMGGGRILLTNGGIPSIVIGDPS